MASLAKVLHNHLQVSQPPVKPKPQQFTLRSIPVDNLSKDEVKTMLREKDFFERSKNKDGKGIQHEYETTENREHELVIDHSTGLIWQRGGSKQSMTLEKAEKYIEELNVSECGGYHDWRLPTLEEVMSLMEPVRQNSSHISYIFDRTQNHILTADKGGTGNVWAVIFPNGSCSRSIIWTMHYVRAVRSQQSR